MKYRVKQIDNKYYPQKRVLFIWMNMQEGRASGSYVVDFPNYQGAKGYIECKISQKKYIPKVKIHNVDL